MMKRKIIRGIYILGRLLAMCLCAVLLCSAAFTEKAEPAGAPVDLASTEGYDRLLDCCALPDGRIVFAGHTEPRNGSGKTAARLLCLNPDRTVCRDYTDPKLAWFDSVTAVDDHTVAVCCDDEQIRFFTADGEFTGRKLSIASSADDPRRLTAFGLLRRDSKEGYTELTGWDGQVLFRAAIPECAWEDGVLSDGDGLVLFGREEGEYADAHAKIVKIDLQGSTVWETVLPFLSEERELTGAEPVLKTGDGGYLAAAWEMNDITSSEYRENLSVLYKLDAGGQILWKNESRNTFRNMAEYDGKYVTGIQEYDEGTGECRMKYLWLDSGGKELGTTEYTLREEELPAYTDRRNLSVSMEFFLPMRDGLWQMYTFWEPDDPEDDEPAWTQQDNALIPVPGLKD